MRKAYIHIGPGKTGSTSVQAFFRHNRDKLKERGLIIPEIVTPRGNVMQNHVMLAKQNEIRKDGTIKPNAVFWSQFEEILTGSQNILLSSEHFRYEFLKTRSIFPRMCAYFETKDYRPVVIAYIRDQPSWLNSRYVQYQSRLFGQLSFDDYVDEVMHEGSVDPWQYLQPYIDNSACDLKIIPFETSARKGLERDFIRFCGIEDPENLDLPGRQRPNAGSKTVYASQVIMEQLDCKVYRLNTYKRAIKSFNKRKSNLGWDKTPYCDLTSERIKRIRDFYADTNKKFARRFFKTTWAKVCPTKTYELSVFDPSKASDDEMAEINDIVARTVKTFRKHLRRKESVSLSKSE